MRKVMMLAAMLAMVLAAAAPAMAQANAVGGNVQIQNQYCPQVVQQYANADQANTGGGTAAAIAQDLGISQSAVNACLQAGNDINVGDDGSTTTVVEGGGDAAAAAAAAASGGSAAAASGGVLPDTGGASLIALGAGALLVAGGLLARKVIR